MRARSAARAANFLRYSTRHRWRRTLKPRSPVCGLFAFQCRRSKAGIGVAGSGVRRSRPGVEYLKKFEIREFKRKLPGMSAFKVRAFRRQASTFPRGIPQKVHGPEIFAQEICTETQTCSLSITARNCVVSVQSGMARRRFPIISDPDLARLVDIHARAVERLADARREFLSRHTLFASELRQRFCFHSRWQRQLVFFPVEEVRPELLTPDTNTRSGLKAFQSGVSEIAASLEAGGPASASEHDPRDPVHAARAECFGLVGKVKAQAVEEIKRLREPIPAEERELDIFPLATRSYRAMCIDGMW